MTTKLTIFLGTVDKSTAIAAHEFDHTAFLIDRNNLESFMQTTREVDTTVFTSLGDLPRDPTLIFRFLDLATEIVYCITGSDKNDFIIKNDYIMHCFEQSKNNVRRLDLREYHPIEFLELADHRRSESPQIWMAGCSMTHAVGVEEDERYGALVAKQLNMPVSFLTEPASSIEWAADQILRSDIRAGDIVIWGLTTENRFPSWNPETNQLDHITIFRTDYIKALPESVVAELLSCKTVEYQAVIHFHQIVNFCRRIGAKMITINLLGSDLLALQLHNTPEFSHYINLKSPAAFVDLGSDNAHPGSKQHQLYAEHCIQQLKKLHYI